MQLPQQVIDLGLQDDYNYAIWILMVNTSYEDKLFNKYALSSDSCSFENKLISIKNDSIISMHFISNCAVPRMIPNTFFFKRHTLDKVDIGDNIILETKDYLRITNYNIKEQNFINKIVKCQNQLNPWLKIEAQRRKII